MWVFVPEMPSVEEVADPHAGARPTPASGAPNVVLVLACTLRRDQTSVYGDGLDTTPFLASLADAGTTFDDVIAAAPWTKAASSAILTGRHPLSIGMIEPKRKRNDRALSAEVPTLAHRLRSRGYQTLGLTANPNLNAIFGFHQGFDRYVQLRELWRTDMTKLHGFQVLGLVDDLLEEADPKRPLYLQLMLVDAHAPFEVSASALAQQARPDLPEQVAAYRAAVRELDEVMSDLYGRLASAGYDPSNTLFVVVSDHGEGLEYPKAHGKAHGRYLFPSAVGAVWMLSGPGIPAGHRIGGVASQVDIVPTLLGLVGGDGYVGPGLDYSALIRGRGPVTRRAEAFTDTWFINVNRAAVYRDELACQRDFGAAGERDGLRFREGCFDRSADPQHMRPLPNADAEAALMAWRAEREDDFEVAPIRDAVPKKEVVEQLEALGYVDP
jgi:arylsulfatase A-like enzyme